MLLRILQFEINYRVKRPATYIYFIILVFISFLATTSENVNLGGSGGQVFKNAPHTIAMTTATIMIFGSLIASAIMGVPVFRDFDYNFHEIIFSTPIKKWEYLGGRFLGSYIIALFVFSGTLIGIFIGSYMPWIDESKIGPNLLMAYVNPFFVFIVPNLFLMGALFFACGSLFRSQLAIYVQGVIFFALYLIIINTQNDIDTSKWLSIFEPFGFAAAANLTRYWTPFDQNHNMIPLSGYLLYNRILWLVITVIISAVFYSLFKFSKSVIQPGKKKLQKETEAESAIQQSINLPGIESALANRSAFKQWRHLTWFNFKSIIKAIPFIALTVCGVIILLLNTPYIGKLYGTSTYPVTYMIMDILKGTFMLFIIIIMTFYTGELMWRDHSLRIAPIIDATPLSNNLMLLAKFFSMILVICFLFLILMLTGIVMQALNGFYDFEMGIYLESLFIYSMPNMILFLMLTFFIHSLVDNKFLGHTLVILFWFSNIILSALDITNNLAWYGKMPITQFSGMNGFGHFMYPRSVFIFYWCMLGIVFLTIAIMMMKRGSEQNFRPRLTVAKNLWKAGKGKLIIPVCIILFFVSGGFIYYNTHVLNTYYTPKQNRKLQAEYEKTFGHLKGFNQPRITDVNVNVDIYPYERQVDFKGRYIIKNKSDKPIDSLIINLLSEMEIKKLETGLPSTQVLNKKELGFHIFKFTKPLLPSDSTTLSFDLHYGKSGFPNNGGSTDVVYNGTFINNDLLPHIGYSEQGELQEDDDRRKEKLPKKKFRMHPVSDSASYKNTYLSTDADWIRYEAIVSTSEDQVAISPGYLQKEWKENGRRYFHYKMDKPIWNFFSFLSARYEVVKDKYNGVNIEIYYQKGHEYDLQRMVKSIKKTLEYCNKNFSPYQHQQVRIIEFPRYATFAQSFPNTIPFSEGIGFIMNVDKETDIDMAFYVTAHEVAHQWWGHQVAGADVQGSTMMVESMAQYSALMVMEHEYGKANMEKFLKYELDRYLQGRSSEQKREQPLVMNENQQYIHYNKGSVVFYAMKDYVGEDSLNKGFSEFLTDYAFKDAPYPNALTFLNYIKRHTPDSLNYLIKDMFETITLYSNKTDTALFSVLKNGQFKVDLSIDAKKLRADSAGNEKEITFNDYIDVGVYTEGQKGKDSLIYIERKKIKPGNNRFEIMVSKKPNKAGVDPLHKLIDRDVEDNTKKAELKS